MKIAHVKITNVLGITELEFTPQGFNEITGRNGEGKTSVLEAIKACLNTGHDATLLRRGAKEGEVVLVLDGQGMEIKKRIKADSSPTEVRQGGKKVSRPAEALRSFADMLAINPVDFLRAPKKDRVRVLLETMPIEVDTEKLSEMAGIAINPDTGLPALTLIDTVHSQVYDNRTGTNRAVKEKQATIAQLSAAIPPSPMGADGDEDDLTNAITEIDSNRDAELRRISAKLDGLRSERDNELQDLRDTLEKRIAAIREELEARINAIREELTKEADSIKEAFNDNERKANLQREKSTNRATESRGPLAEQLAVIRNDREAAGRRAQTIDTITNLETELEGLVDEAAQQTRALSDIEKYKSELLDSLPIPGLEVKGGEVFRNGVQFDRLNTAQQVDIAVEIAKLRAGGLGVICVDGIELLDSGAFDAFKTRSIESGLQLFVSKVSDDDFSINTDA
jgi:DNA repair exonuclease SbcCD ATPase subunit